MFYLSKHEMRKKKQSGEDAALSSMGGDVNKQNTKILDRVSLRNIDYMFTIHI